MSSANKEILLLPLIYFIFMLYFTLSVHVFPPPLNCKARSFETKPYHDALNMGDIQRTLVDCVSYDGENNELKW